MAQTTFTRYDEHAYPTQAQPQLHPDNIYSTAVLRGFRPVPVNRARVLELGCGNGLNLVPMAMDLPEADFVGVDYARGPIAIAQQLAADLQVTNVRFLQADVQELPEDFGEFDYILAHGLYSWIPEPVRDAFWRVARCCLSPKGLLMFSYNTLPAWHLTGVLRDFCSFHTEGERDHQKALGMAWEAISTLSALEGMQHPLVNESLWSKRKGLPVALHDELDSVTQPFHFREVAGRAAMNGFHYVGDAAEQYVPGLHMIRQVHDLLQASCGDDLLRREQYLDFFTNRAFRQSIFARQGHASDSSSAIAGMRELWIGSSHDAGPPAADGLRQVSAPGSAFRFETADAMVGALFDALTRVRPGLVHLGEWIEASLHANPSWVGGELQNFHSFLAAAAHCGVFRYYPRNIPIPATVPARPRVRTLNGWEIAQGLNATNLFHDASHELDALPRSLALLLNGERNREDVTEALAHTLWELRRGDNPSSHAEENRLPPREANLLRPLVQQAGTQQHLRESLQETVPDALETLRKAAILVA